MAKDHERVKLLCFFNDNQYQEIFSYNDIIRHFTKYHGDLDVYKLKCLTAYEGPILPHHHSYKGSN